MDAEGPLVMVMSAQIPRNSADRYAVHPAGTGWCVWDTLRDEPVFGAERLTECQARALAHRLSEAYRQACPGRSGLSERLH